MKTLEEHNTSKRRRYFSTDISQLKNDIACPDCGEELYDTNPNEITASIPPQKRIHCEECDYTGLRVA